MRILSLLLLFLVLLALPAAAGEPPRRSVVLTFDDLPLARGYAFVRLDEALRDPAYATPDTYIGTNGPSWLHRWRAGLGLPSRLRDEPDMPAWAYQAWRALLQAR